MTKRRVLSAFRDFRDFTTEDPWYGFMGPSSILNHAHKHDGMPVHNIHAERSRVGWMGGKTSTTMRSFVRRREDFPLLE